MKKLLLSALIVAVAVLSLTGCSSTSSSSGTTTSAIPAADLASSVGASAGSALTIGNSILGVIISAGTKPAGVSAASGYGLAYTDGWWHATSSESYSYGGVTISLTYDYNFRVWNAGGTEIVTLPALAGLTTSDIGRVHTYTTFTYSTGTSTSTTTLGNSKSDPLVFDALTTTPTVTGTVKYSGTYSSTNYSLTLTFGGLHMAGTYPSGTVSYSVTEGGATSASGSVTFNGTNICQISVTTGGTTYNFTYNIDTSVTTPASI